MKQLAAAAFLIVMTLLYGWTGALRALIVILVIYLLLTRRRDKTTE